MSASIFSTGTLTGTIGSPTVLTGTISFDVQEVFVDTVFTYKGSVESMVDLAGIVASEGDVYYLTEEDSNYAYSGGRWHDIGTNSMQEDLTPEQIAELQGLVH